MCGFAGYIGALPSDGNVLNRMISAIRHRGPDDDGVWTDTANLISLVHRRLSIVDLSPQGHQPMISHCGRYVIAYNGEVYNHHDMRRELESSGCAPNWRGHSDTEVILAAIAAWGIKNSLAKMVGMFAFALWDRDAKSLTLVRDRIGEKPLYFGWGNNATFLFGSELKALRPHPDWRGEIDRNALALFMRHNFVPAPHSIYTGIQKLQPGFIATIKLSGAGKATEPKFEQYWSLADVAVNGMANQFKGTFVEAVDQIEKQLSRTIAEQMVADVPLGAFLSGGIDSSTIVALMQRQSSRPVRTFTIGFAEADFNEANFAKEVAHHLGTHHTEFYVSPEEARNVIPALPHLYDEPFADSSQIPTFLVAQLARQHVTVSLSGDGGDELYGGYPRYAVGAYVWRRAKRIPHSARRLASGCLQSLTAGQWDALISLTRRALGKAAFPGLSGQRVIRLANVLSATDFPQMYRALISQWQEPSKLVIGSLEPDTILSAKSAFSDHITEMMYLDMMMYLPDDILAKVDRATMGVSLEARVPLLDHRVIEFAWSLPDAMRIGNGTDKRVLREVLFRHVPRHLIERPKMGFGIPLGSWLGGPLKEWAAALLDPGRLRSEGYLNADIVSQAWEEHVTGKYDRQHQLWSVLMFQAWLASEKA